MRYGEESLQAAPLHSMFVSMQFIFTAFFVFIFTKLVTSMKCTH